MTEIPEHLLKRAQAARDKSAADEAAAAPAAAAAEPAAAAPIGGGVADPGPPARAVARGQGRRRRPPMRRSGGGGVAVQDRVTSVVQAAPTAAGVPVGAGPGGHTQRLLTVVKSGSIQEVKASPVDKVHTWPHLLAAEFVASLVCLRVHVRLLDLRQRPAAASWPTRTRRRTRRRRRGTSSACRNC